MTQIETLPRKRDNITVLSALRFFSDWTGLRRNDGLMDYLGLNMVGNIA